MGIPGGGSGKRPRVDMPDDDLRQRMAKERKAEHSLRKIETHMMAGFSKLHSTGVIINQAKSNIEMIGSMISRQKEQLKSTRLRLIAALPQDFRLTTVAAAASTRFDQAMMDQTEELTKIEQALSAAHEAVAEQNVQRHGPWPPVPPIKARPDTKPRTPPRR